VVVPAYQAAGTIAEALESAFAQSRPPLEVLVVDDGSTDDLDAALAPYRDRIVLIRQPNRGEAAARNAGVRAARGDFVVALDADDTFLPERLEALAELAQARPDLDILTTDAHLRLGDSMVGRYYRDRDTFEVADQRASILRESFIWPPAVRRSVWLAHGGFDEDQEHRGMPWVDWEFYARLIVAGSRAGLVDEPLAVYRLHPGSLTGSRLRTLQGRVVALERMGRIPGLTAAEREGVSRLLSHYRRQAALADAEDSLRRNAAHRRRRALSVALGSGFGPRTRGKAAFAALLPGVAGRYLARRELRTGASRLLPRVPSGPAAGA
jgi:glycosyltransferase involved in cell wall biosynthesis